MKKKDGFTIAIIRVSDGRMAIWHEDCDTTTNAIKSGILQAQ